MSYISQTILPGEQIRYEAHFHWLEKFGALVLCFVVVGFFYIIWMWCAEMAITDRRMIYKRGWIIRRTEEISLHRIEEVNLRQSILGRILGYGKLSMIVCNSGTRHGRRQHHPPDHRQSHALQASPRQSEGHSRGSPSLTRVSDVQLLVR